MRVNFHQRGASIVGSLDEPRPYGITQFNMKGGLNGEIFWDNRFPAGNPKSAIRSGRVQKRCLFHLLPQWKNVRPNLVAKSLGQLDSHVHCPSWKRRLKLGAQFQPPFPGGTMNMAVELSKTLRDEIWAHVLPLGQEVEQAAFLYATASDGRFRVTGWEPVVPEDFTIQTSFHIELSDAVRARLIKRAHDRSASLVEIHSHLGPWAAQFSPSDLAGFEEWVPHVRWRLKGKPYGAFV